MSAAAMAFVAKGSGRRRTTMIVTARQTAAVEAAVALPDIDARCVAMDAAWEDAKRPMLDLVRRMAGSGLRVANLMTGSPCFVAIGPRSAWRELLSSPETALCGADFEPDDPECWVEPPSIG